MIEVSEAWKSTQQRFLLPETFVEISCYLTEAGAQEEASASGVDEAIFSEIESVTGIAETQSTPRYATLEPNLWALDGTRNILPDADPYSNAGYVSDVASSGSVTLTLPTVHSATIPGVTVVWSSEYGEYATVFTVTAKNGNDVVAETTVTDNKETRSLVYMEISDYDSVTVTVHAWSVPNHRARIDLVKLGLDMTFTKKDILSYKHEQTGCIVSGELPKNSIEFSLDNSNNRWNPHNPNGLERFLSERQRLTVRYGMDIDGATEWIKAGTFYLSEWKAPANGLEASFVARDMFEFLIGAGGVGAAIYDTLTGVVEFAKAYLPEEAVVVIDSSLDNYSASYVGKTSHAESVQKCANAAGCILRTDRDGVLHIEPLNTTPSDYVITTALSYSYPEVDLSKPLASVAVSYEGSEDNPYILTVDSVGEQQTVDNDYITSQEQAAVVAEWVGEMLSHRKHITGEFRADPRLDVFDIVQVESKYGLLSPVVITNITYTYSGAFKGSFTGRVLA